MKTGRIAPELPLFCRTLDIRKTVNLRKTINLRKALNIRKTLNLRKVLNIRKILPLLDDRNGIYRVSEARENKAGRPVLDAEEVTVSPSINAKGSRILFSKDLYIYPVKED